MQISKLHVDDQFDVKGRTMETTVLCEVRPGLRDSERTVAVSNVHNRKEFLRIEASYLRSEAGRTYLPVGFMLRTSRKRIGPC